MGTKPQKTKRGFGPKTFGIYNIEKFINNILNEAKKQLDIKSYIFGKVIYQYSPVFISSSNLGGSYKLNEKSTYQFLIRTSLESALLNHLSFKMNLDLFYLLMNI